MSKQYTKAEARQLFNVPTDYQLSQKLETSHQRLSRYSDDDVLSIAFQWQIRALIAEGKVRPTEVA